MIITDLVIIGAGVAGLSAAQTARLHSLSTVVLDSMGAGGQCINCLHIENYPGISPDTSGIEFIKKLEDRVLELGAEVVTDTVSQIEVLPGGFKIFTTESEFQAKQLILATGTEPLIPSIPGIVDLIGKGVSTCALCDGPFFKDLPVGVIGGGDSALEEALFLGTICSKVHLFVRASFSAQPYLRERIHNAKNIETHFQSEIIELNTAVNSYGFQALSGVKLVSNETFELRGLFISIGSEPTFPKIMNQNLPLNPDKTILTDTWCETTIPGLFAVGGIKSHEYPQFVTIASDGSLAGRKAYLNINNTKG